MDIHDGGWTMALSVPPAIIRWNPQRGLQNHCLHRRKTMVACGPVIKSQWAQTGDRFDETLQPLLQL